MADLKYPLEIDPIKKTLVTVDGIDKIQSQIMHVLQTEPYERVMRPDYGVPNFIFDSISSIYTVTATIERRLVTELGDKAEFRVNGVINDSGGAVIEVYWSQNGVSQTPIRYNLN